MTGDGAERRLREWFQARADGPVPDDVRDRLAAIPSEPTAQGGWPFALLRVGGVVAAVAFVVVGAVAFAVLGSSPRSGIGATPSAVPGPVTAGGIAAGDGLVDLGIPWLPILVTLLTLGVLVAGWRPHLALRIGAVALVGLVAAGDVVLANGPRLGWHGGSYGAGPGFVRWSDSNAAFVVQQGGGQDMVFAPGPHGSFGFSVTVTNEGGLPLTILGLDRAQVTTGVAYPQIIGLGTPPDQQVVNSDPAKALPFQPVRLDPGQQVNLVFLGEGGPCAASTEVGSTIAYGIPDLRLVTEAIGWPRVDTFRLPFGVIVRAIDNCGADGPVTP